MKRIITLLLLLTLSKFATAQLSFDNETFPYNGFNVNHYGLWWYPDPATTGYGPMAYLTAFGGIKFFTTGGPRAVLDVNGYFGIGTLSPVARLDVAGNASVGVGNTDVNIQFKGYNGAYSQIYSNAGASGNYNGLILTNNTNSANSLPCWTLDIGGADNINYSNSDTYSIRRMNAEVLRINSAGNVGIGTKSPGSYKLAVNGGIHSQSVNVDLTGWSDYVFKKEYRLPSLTDVKTYIDQNHRLPDMPSEQEVVKDGINLGEMNKLLTKKVEELTLYLIEQNKQIIKQQMAMEAQQKQIDQLNKKFRASTKAQTQN